MLISKSLFVDYKDFPKLAWWKQNNIATYRKIKWLEEEEQAEQLIELWQKVEDLVWNYFLKKFWLERLDVFEDNTAKNPLDEEDEDIKIIAVDYKTKRENNLKRTIEAIQNKEVTGTHILVHAVKRIFEICRHTYILKKDCNYLLNIYTWKT